MGEYGFLRKKPFFLSEQQILWVDQTICSMTMEEKAGQLFFLDLYGPDREQVCLYLDTYHMGGFMVRQMPLHDLTEVIGYAQQRAEIPLLVSANLESGGSGMIREGTDVGPCLQVGATGDVSFAEKQARVCAGEGMAAGANYAFAPVTDLAVNFRNPITGTRVYGSDPEFVARAGSAFIKELQSIGMAAAVKHFPGDGVDERDQHQVATVNSLSCKEWEETYGKVYRRCIETGAMTVMAGHILMPELSRKYRPGIRDEEILPATLSPELLQDLLRKELGFNGLIISDNTAMAGFYAMPREKAVQRAVEAGCDMLLFSRNLEEDYQAVLSGIRNGSISQKRLHEALARILGLKAALGLPEKQKNGSLIPDLKKAGSVVGCDEFRNYEKECADRAVTLVKEEKGVLPLDPARYRRILLYALTHDPRIPSRETRAGLLLERELSRAGFQVDFFETSDRKDGFMESCRELEKRYDLILYAADLPTESFRTTVRLEWRKPMGADCPVMIHTIPTVFISFANPFHLADVPRIRTYLNAYCCKEANVKAVVEKLMGKSPFLGKNPVDPFCGFWDAGIQQTEQ